MAKVMLELSEVQVLSLLHQLSQESWQTLVRLLLTDLNVEVEDADDADAPEAFVDDDHPWSDPLDELSAEWKAIAWSLGPIMTRRHLLAAETFHYSYAHYEERLGTNVRFDELMPEDVDLLERAEREDWESARLAEALEVDEEHVEHWRESYRRALAIVDAPTPAEAFRRGVRFSIEDAVEEGLDDEGAVETLVGQICYRAADLAFLLDLIGLSLSDYSQELRDESLVSPDPASSEDSTDHTK